MQIVRLTAAHSATAGKLFAMMAEVLGDASLALSEPYLQRLLRSDAFWAVAALNGDEVVGGVTAHSLPMTRGEFSEIFVYDIAVAARCQRQGIGRGLVQALREYAAETGIRSVFVVADNADGHALDFYRALGGKPSSVTLFSFEEPYPKEEE